MRGVKKPICCPKCRSEDVLEIIYGLPGESLLNAAQKGKVVLGGCCITGNDPEFHCKSCGNDFRKRGGMLWG